MSDFGIVGMGLIHVPPPIFTDTSEKSTTCDLECIFPAKGKFKRVNDLTRLFRYSQHEIY